MSDSVDLLDHPIDDRARRAAAQLHRAASLRALPDLPHTRSRAGRTALLTMAVVAAVVTGLIVIGNRHNDVQPAGPNDDLHWVIDGLPQGWAPVEVRGPAADGSWSRDNPSPIITIFGTAAAPEGPVFETFAYASGFSTFPAEGRASDYVEQTVDGVDVVLATSATGSRLAWAKISNAWVPMQAAGMSDDELGHVAAHLIVGADGSTQVAPGHMPSGVSELASGTIEQVAPAFWAGVATQGTAPGTLSISYQDRSEGGQYVQLTVSRAVAGQLAFVALTSEVTPVQIDGIQVWQRLDEQGLAAQATWQRDGQLFVLTASEPGRVDLPSLAAGVRPATEAEWAGMPSTAVSSSDQTSGTSTVDTGPAITAFGDASASTDSPVAPGDGVSGDVVRDIALDWTITDRQAHATTLETTLPDGATSRITVTVVGDSIGLSSDEIGGMTYDWPDDAATILEDQNIGAIAVTHDPRATQLRVLRANGDRYTMDLVTVSGEPATKFAAVTLPQGELVSSDLLDADGNVIEHFQRS